jgi:outer membrane scaffolding protein for murein synthesis (MipA/OmpV family)
MLASPVFADQVPLWEVGAGIGAIDFPHYRGSNERQQFVFPMPYINYRGDFLKIDHHRARGELFHTDNIDLDISVNGSVPVMNNQARQGMPNLGPSFEVGPSVNIMLYQPSSEKSRLELRLPLRAVIGIEYSRLHDVGWIFQPLLNLDIPSVLHQTGCNLNISIGPIFADNRYNQYFYGIDSQFSRSDRPAFTAHSGYAGSQFAITAIKRFPTFWMSGYIKLDSVRGAAFENSSLVKSRESATVGFAIAWIFAESPEKVEDKDDIASLIAQQ